MALKISTKGRYALRVLADLTVHDNGDYISLKSVAERQMQLLLMIPFHLQR